MSRKSGVPQQMKVRCVAESEVTIVYPACCCFRSGRVLSDHRQAEAPLHDCGQHGDAPVVHRVRLEQLATLHYRDLLAEFRDELCRRHPELDERLPELPEPGDLDVDEILDATFAFA